MGRWRKRERERERWPPSLLLFFLKGMGRCSPPPRKSNREITLGRKRRESWTSSFLLFFFKGMGRRPPPFYFFFLEMATLVVVNGRERGREREREVHKEERVRERDDHLRSYSSFFRGWRYGYLHSACPSLGGDVVTTPILLYSFSRHEEMATTTRSLREKRKISTSILNIIP